MLLEVYFSRVLEICFLYIDVQHLNCSLLKDKVDYGFLRDRKRCLSFERTEYGTRSNTVSIVRRSSE
jgi:hypothetical protein